MKMFLMEIAGAKELDDVSCCEVVKNKQERQEGQECHEKRKIEALFPSFLIFLSFLLSFLQRISKRSRAVVGTASRNSTPN